MNELARLSDDLTALAGFDAPSNALDDYLRLKGVDPATFHGIQPATGAMYATPPDNGMVDNVLRRLASGLAFGLADEGSAAVTAGINSLRNWLHDYPVDFGAEYDLALERERATDRAFFEYHPWLAVGSELAGQALGAVTGSRIVPSWLNPSNIPTLPGKVAGGAAAGAVSMGATDFGHARGGTENRMKAAVDGSESGAIFGAGFTTLGALLRGRAPR